MNLQYLHIFAFLRKYCFPQQHTRRHPYISSNQDHKRTLLRNHWSLKKWSKILWKVFFFDIYIDALIRTFDILTRFNFQIAIVHEKCTFVDVLAFEIFWGRIRWVAIFAGAARAFAKTVLGADFRATGDESSLISKNWNFKFLNFLFFWHFPAQKRASRRIRFKFFCLANESKIPIFLLIDKRLIEAVSISVFFRQLSISLPFRFKNRAELSLRLTFERFQPEPAVLETRFKSDFFNNSLDDVFVALEKMSSGRMTSICSFEPRKASSRGAVNINAACDFITLFADRISLWAR